MKKTISLHGSYFGNNYGDILLVKLFATWIKEICPDAVINMPLGNKSTACDLEYDTTGYRNLVKSDALVFCGGGYFGEQPKGHYRWAVRNFLRHGLIGIIAILFRIPYIIIGVEFGPISVSWFRKVCVYIAKNAHTVVVRNQQSYDFLTKYGVSNVKLSADAVLSISCYYPPKSTDCKSKKILIHSNRMPCDSQKYLDILKGIIKSAKENFTDFCIGFISDGPGNYYENSYYLPSFMYLKEEGITHSIINYETCDQLIKEINDADYIITTKLHVGITAAALNKQVLSLWLHNKTPRLHAQIENSNNCVEFSKLGGDTQKVFDAFFSSTNYVLPQKVKKQALLNRYELHLFLSSFYLNKEINIV